MPKSLNSCGTNIYDHLISIDCGDQLTGRGSVTLQLCEDPLHCQILVLDRPRDEGTISKDERKLVAGQTF